VSESGGLLSVERRRRAFPRAEFDAIMAAPKKRYMDYPNLQNHWVFGRGLDLYRYLKHSLRWIR